MATARDAGPAGAFATYTMGEVRLREDPAAAVEILELALSQAEAGRTAQIAEVARIAAVQRLQFFLSESRWDADQVNSRRLERCWPIRRRRRMAAGCW